MYNISIVINHALYNVCFITAYHTFRRIPMPPKAKYTYEDYVRVALDIARTQGMDSVVAREVGNRMGMTQTPIYSLFGSMEGLRNAVRKAAMDEFSAIINDALQYSPAFKQFGLFMIRFAKDEPELFRILFMTERVDTKNFALLIPQLGDCAETVIGRIEVDYSLSRPQAELMFRQMWLFTYGICTALVNGVYDFSAGELEEILGKQFLSVLLLCRSGADKVNTPHPEKGSAMPDVNEVIGNLGMSGKHI